MKRLLVFLMVLLVACSAQQTDSPVKKESTSDVLNTITTPSQEVSVAEEPKITSCNVVDDKVAVVYDGGQKESFKPYCLEKDEQAFKSFIQVYYCDGLNVKSKLIRCTGNETCLKGECV